MSDELLTMSNVSWQLNNRIFMEKLKFSLIPGECHAIVGILPSELQNFQKLITEDNILYEGDFQIFGKQRKDLTLCGNELMTLIDNNDGIFTTMTVAQNLFLNDRNIYFMPKKQAVQKASKTLEKYGLYFGTYEKAENLTPEERKILEVVRACESDKKIILLYDTMYYLGSNFIQPFMKILENLKQRKVGVIYITSRIEDAIKFAERISVLDKGTIRQTFNKDEIIQQPRKLLYYLSGWESLYDSSLKEECKLLDTIISVRNLESTGTEVNQVLQYLAESIENIFSAYDAEIVFLDDELEEIVERICTKDIPVLEFPYTYFAKKEQKESEDFFLIENKEEISDYMPGRFPVNYVVCKYIQLNQHLTAVIQICYEKKHVLTDFEKKYLVSFGKEIVIAMEMGKYFEQSVMLRESHHRIKNNLQMIINLLYLQKRSFSPTTDDKVLEAFDSVIGRVKSVAMVHILLTNNKLNSSLIRLDQIIEEIARPYMENNIKIEMDIVNIMIPYNKAVSVAMLINEMVSNSIKHAFTGKIDRRIWIVASIINEYLLLQVRDNGKGFPDSFSMEKCDSLGMDIMNSITRELSGKMEYGNSEGAFVQVAVPEDVLFV